MLIFCMEVGYAVSAFHLQIYPVTIVDGTGLLQRKILSVLFFYLHKLCCKKKSGEGGVEVVIKEIFIVCRVPTISMS
jgi:hypothetical protein